MKSENPNKLVSSDKNYCKWMKGEYSIATYDRDDNPIEPTCTGCGATIPYCQAFKSEDNK